MPRQAKSLPILMYHNISNYRDKLSIPPALFEEHCRTTAEKGWRAVGLTEAEDFFLHGAPLPAGSFLITLDDGYLDNYVNAWPILAKYGHKAVIFPVADLITAATEDSGPHAAPRPSLAEVWAGRLAPEDLPAVDNPLRHTPQGYPVREDRFFTWPEARAMQESGVISFGGHGLGHNGVFSGPEYETFLRPAGRTAPLDHLVKEMIWGMPWFKRASEFTARAFTPAPELLAAVRALVPQDEAAACEFFLDEANQLRLKELADSFAGNLGRLETERERMERLSGIFAKNQNIFRRELGHPARSFCWPWGRCNESSIQAASESGFSVFFNVSPGPNRPGKALNINRFSAKRDTKKTLNRLRIYSRPLLGALYLKARL
ncbi:MAG: polysaccharide deacetylase family protein [Deltaproteobacteria bacterium]|jgi:peptidoglycan/xylan/chitin deacetylase (PgdA/CDA1 family)|nr:polysaccharide deacetylase family protein [Deltaproteobacteria bacterium]